MKNRKCSTIYRCCSVAFCKALSCVHNLKKENVKTARHDLKLYLKLNPTDPLAPELKELVASLPDETPSAEGSNITTEPTEMSERSKQLTERFLMRSRQNTQDYQDETLRGERPALAGDIETDNLKRVTP